MGFFPLMGSAVLLWESQLTHITKMRMLQIASAIMLLKMLALPTHQERASRAGRVLRFGHWVKGK
jgi:hypothetical protein